MSKKLPSVVRRALTNALRASASRGLQVANQTARCLHVKSNGVQCGSPAMRGQPFCYFHESMHNMPYEDSFPPLEDADGIQVCLMQVLNGFKDGKIDRMKASTMTYILQTASANLRGLRFGCFAHDIVTEDPISVARRAEKEAAEVQQPEPVDCA